MSETFELYRLCRKKYARELIASGFANRWNSKAQKVIYCASSRSLASLELLVHRSRIVPGEPYVMMAIPIHEPVLMITDTPLSSLP